MFGLLDFGDVLQMCQVGLLEVEAAEVFQGFSHLFNFSGWE
jgi:hypothetical protein